MVDSDSPTAIVAAVPTVPPPTPSAPASDPPVDHTIVLQHCNSIEEATITLRAGSLNIKYGPNGVGKSTIARALVLRAEGDEALQELLPFAARGGDGDIRSQVSGAEEITKVLVFDEDYVQQFVFQRDEVVRDSFKIFINTPEFQEGNAQIDELFRTLTETFADNPVLDEVIGHLSELRDAFTVTQKGVISKKSKGFKALKVGGKLQNVPRQLQGYSGFLQGEDPAGWISWQARGKAYLEMSDNCPFCAVEDVDRQRAEKVSEEYETSAVKNMSRLREVITRLGGAFAPDAREKLEAITQMVDDLSPEQEQFLVGLHGQVETLLGKFVALKGLSFGALRDEEDVAKAVKSLTIDLSLLGALDSPSTRDTVEDMNRRLDEVAEQLNEIRKRVGIQKSTVAKLIESNQREINEFLSSAGYRYLVRIEPSEDSYRMILEHRDAPGHLESAGRHLSYGERNAFALVLFMHQVLQQRPDLVVLDDPVSSFDRTKKFAILHKLFHGRGSIKEFTTLLLTHDIEPAIDIIRTATSQQFQAVGPVAHFLSSHGGRVEEKRIRREDLMTFSQVCEANIAAADDDVIKCIYLRRSLEVHGESGEAYDVLSSLLHLREAPARKGADGTLEPLAQAELDAAVSTIQERIPDFDYDRLLAELRDPKALTRRFNATDVGYEQVQLFRVALELKDESMGGDPAFNKFVNETFHIENEYVMQLDPRQFDAVPEYVSTRCVELFREAFA